MTLQTATITETILVEEAQLTDIESLKKLLKQLVPDQNPEYGIMLVDLSESIKSNYNKWFVVRNNERVVGCCQLIIYRNLIRSPYRKAIIDSVIIDEENQYLGFGKLMIEKVLDYAKDHQVGKVQLISSFPRTAAHHFYEKMNFAKMGYGYIIDLSIRKRSYFL
ncbi:MAG: N-acetyltransferase family protein [Bacteroidia bacterium]